MRQGNQKTKSSQSDKRRAI